MNKLLILAAMLFAFACKPKNSENSNETATKHEDVHSYANPSRAVVKHLDLDIKVDFDSKLISGKASWTIENPSKGDEIIFDSRNLKISKITLGDDEKETTFSLGDDTKFLGQALKVKIEDATTKVNIYYTNSADAAAVQWLNPQQTAGKKYPFMFTQSQAILARTWIPCQDSPGIRFTYNAKVTVPRELLALMSAENPQEKNADGVYTFKQPNPIPSYLMALAVGDMAFKSVDNRTGVYAEPLTLEKAAYELADMGKMTTAAEKIYGPYKWGRYDVLVLPPSFPFGGMENPMLTFATPTIIAGDRSLVSLIAHELAHSWSGNLVTNANWNDFWLNEGFTTYFERRIVEDVYGKDEAKMQELLGYQGLQELATEMGATNADTKLKGDYEGRDPDEGVSDIAYEKGYSFIRTIEEAVGRERFDKFLRGYFDSHAFRSVTTEEFLAYLDENLIKGDKVLKDKINVDAWVYQPGLPNNSPAVGSDKFKSLDSLISQWQKSGNIAALNKKMSTNEALYLISHLPANITLNQMADLDKMFRFTASGNSEIQAAWYTLAVRMKYQPAYTNIENFLTEVGRRKFLMPLYKEMVKTAEGKEWAKKIYAKARPNYHSVAYNSIDELLK
ncbi:M1 family metallopeptidase [Daejeonella lutea]|uniref:Aminopeptidase N n=1 Tax=Daejeonella lutea TaxID=572036 RepID=A0A1T5DU28_9SPHI|nr:M1 family metallopeptidase [Daejeonella lutea]SKB75312.1 leukotriene A-4 hydrolase/aminopeptidase [Daejeonella lutea]